MNLTQIIIYCILLTNLCSPLRARILVIGDSGDYTTLSAAEEFILPGDTLMLQNQNFDDGSQFLEDINGLKDSPILIKSDSLHGAVFTGGTEAIHLINCSWIIIDGLVIEQQTGNGINIDDGGDYSTPTKHITIRNCIFRDMAAGGNNDLLKLSGLDSFEVNNCMFLNGGGGGSGVDMVGCHYGMIQRNYFDDSGTSGIQAKGGTQFIRIQYNTFRDINQRALNLGGSTGLEFFRPPLPDTIENAFEAADLEVFCNIFIGSRAPIAYVGSVRVRVINNTIYYPDNWVIRILQETTVPGFLPCMNNEFRNNIVVVESDLTEVNIGSNTEPETFIFTNNLWFNESDTNWSPNLPVTDSGQVISDPNLLDPSNDNFRISNISPAVMAGIKVNDIIFDYDHNFYFEPPSIGAFEGYKTGIFYTLYS